MSDQRFACSALCCTFSEICFACYHGLSHARYVSSSNILRTVHFAVGCHPLPWVRPITLCLNVLMIHLFTFNVSISTKFNLLLPLLTPFCELISSMSFTATLQVFLSLLLLIELLFTLLCLLLNTLNSLAFFIIKIVFSFSLHTRAS